jgi:arsenate reductase
MLQVIAMEKTRVLFVCTHNSARSQMAETFLNALGQGRFEAESAGLEPRGINPLVVEVMKEIGFDVSKKPSSSVLEFFKQGRLYHHVIFVCDKSTEEQCPIFPGLGKRHSWPFPDPSRLEGTHEEKLAQTRKIRDDIKSRIDCWIREIAEA